MDIKGEVIGISKTKEGNKFLIVKLEDKLVFIGFGCLFKLLDYDFKDYR